MTAATVQSFNLTELPSDHTSGTAGFIRRIGICNVRAIFAAGNDTINLATYAPGATGVLGIGYHSIAGVPGTAGFTVSTTTLTHTNNGGYAEFGAYVYF